jgi:hypothetical protein
MRLRMSEARCQGESIRDHAPIDGMSVRGGKEQPPQNEEGTELTDQEPPKLVPQTAPPRMQRDGIDGQWLHVAHDCNPPCAPAGIVESA